MRACVVLDVGVIVDCVILRRAERQSDFNYTTSIQTFETASNLNTAVNAQSAGPQLQSGLSGDHSFILSGPNTPRAAASSRGVSPRSANGVDPLEAVHYVVRTSMHPHVDLIAHEMDVVPFGFSSPSAVFAVRGRHLNIGLSRMVLEDGGVLVEKHGAGYLPLKEKQLANLIPTPQPHLLSKLPEQQEQARKARSDREGGPLSPLESAIANLRANPNVSMHTISELQLLPMLSASKPTLPLAVGTSIKCRRCGNSSRLFCAVVKRARYDCTYTVEYENDRSVERGVLHNDVLVLNDSCAEDVRVRDKVTFTVIRPRGAVHGEGVVTCAQGGNKFLVYGALHQEEHADGRDAGPAFPRYASRSNEDDDGEDSSPVLSPVSSSGGTGRQRPQRGRLFLLPRENIIHIAPHYTEALQSEHVDTLLPIFRALDEEGAGTVPWVAVVKFFSTSEYAGQPLTPSDWGMLHREVVSRHGAVRRAAAEHRSGLAGADAAVLDTQLTFSDFELIANRILNMKW